MGSEGETIDGIREIRHIFQEGGSETTSRGDKVDEDRGMKGSRTVKVGLKAIHSSAGRQVNCWDAPGLRETANKWRPARFLDHCGG